MPESRTTYRVCTLCEATCGIQVDVQEGRVVALRGDSADPFSRGYICPKAYGMKGLEEDPDRLRGPVRKTSQGFEPISWEDAFSLVVSRLNALREKHGPDAVGAYLGNPSAHSLHTMLYGPVLLKALGTKRVFSATSADQLPKMLSSGLMFGAPLTIPVPDIDRTSYLLMLGANPVVSNGSLMTAPDVKKRLRAIVARGGKVVVVDPRYTETAELSSEHLALRPGSDAGFLLALCQVMFAEGLVTLGAAAPHVKGLDALRAAVAPYTPERVTERTGIAADTIRRIAREISSATTAACYGRIGTTCQEFGTLSSWAVDLVNILSGNLDREGGALFTRPAANRGANRPVDARGGRGVKLGRWAGPVTQLPERFGELPVSSLTEEILDPAEHRMRAMVTVAGNPVLSAPDGDRLEKAFQSLELMVSVDLYINETTRHADVILPPPPPLQRDTYDLALYQFAIQNVAKYSQPAVPKPATHPDEWEILLTLTQGLMNMAEVPLSQADEFVFRTFAEKEIGDGGRWAGLSLDEVMTAVQSRGGPSRLLDFMLRIGPYGDGFGREPGGLTLAVLEDNPHGVHLGPLMPQLPGVLRTPDARIDVAPQALLEDLKRFDRALSEPNPQVVLVGRRHLRSNNSWMHNLTSLVKGPPRCTLLVNPEDAIRLGVSTGDTVRVSSRVGAVQVPAEVSEEMMPGVVSLPHGWGHDVDGVKLSVARAHAGVNVNVLSDPLAVDAASGNAAFNGLPVTLTAVPASADVT